MKKPTFKTAYLIYTVTLLLVVGILLFSVYRILDNYEQSQAKYTVEDSLKLIQEAVDNQEAATLSAFHIDASTRFTTTEELTRLFLANCKGKTLDYTLSPKSFDVNNPIYNILCDEVPVARLQLRLISEEVKLGFLSIPEWEFASFTPLTDPLCTAYTLSVPKDFTVTADGILLTSDDIVSEEDEICAYYADGFVKEPVFEIRDAFGNKAQTETATLLNTDEKSAQKIYSVPVTYERFDLTVPSDFTVALEKGNISYRSNEDSNTFSIYTATPVDLAFLTQNVSATDSIGNPLVFREADGRLLPVYSEYTVVAADCYRVFADDVLLNLEDAERTALTMPQYLDEEVSLATYRIGLAKDVTFSVLDSQDNQVAFETASNRIEVPLFDCTVTIPDNYELLINGKQPNTEPQLKDNPDYQYVAEYIEVPKLMEYRFEDLATAPTVTITDNQLNQTNYILNNGDKLALTEQKGLDSLPDWLSNQFDPLEIAKKWSLYLTDDLGGTLSGYYTLRDYLIRGSYYDTVAYRWAVDVDITFISDHILLNPTFTQESLTNVVVYSDTCFSCDIFFIKHMQLVRTGKLQDDTFHRRMYFIYLDDTNDGKENPHWVIADMQEIQ